MKKMSEQKQTIVFDSSGLTALLNETDEFHDRALLMSDVLTDSASWRVLLPREIFAETITAISKRVNREAGVNAAWAILERRRVGDFIFIETDPLVYEKAIGMLQTAKGSRGAPSFFDCLVMAFASQYQTPYIFGFDDAFAKNGYRLPEAAEKEQVA
jgi:predicted nucleic acid-binding protein